MPFHSFQKLATRIALNIVQKSYGHKRAVSYIREWLRGIDLLESRTSASIPRGKEYSASVWVFRAVNIWMQLGIIPMKLTNNDDDDTNEITTGPVAFLIKSPNSKMSQRQFIERCIYDLALHGRAYITREDGTNFNSVPAYLDFLPASRVRVDERDFDDDGYPTRFTVTRKNGTQYKVDARGVIVVSLPMGISPISAARASIDADYAARQHNAHMMANHGRIGGMITFDDPNINEDQLKDYAKLWNETYAGPENAGKTAFLTKASYTSINQSMKDLDWLNGQYVSREEIFAAFSIPPIIAGDLRYGTYANYEAAAKEVWTSCLMPLGGRILAALQKHIVDPNQRRALLVFDYEAHIPALREDKTSRIQQYTQLIREGFVSPEQAAKIVGLQIGETSDLHKTIWTTFQLVPAESALYSPPPPNEPTGDQNNDEPPAKAAQPARQNRATPQPVVKSDDAREHLRTLKWKALMNVRIPYERRMADVLKRYFFDQRSEWLANLDAFVAGKKAVLKSWNPKELVDAIVGDFEKWNERLLSDVKPVVEGAISISAKDVLAELGKDPNSYQSLALTKYRQSLPVILKKVNETTYDRLLAAARAINEAITSGASVDEAAEKMKAAIRGELAASEGRRRVIARTEIGRAFEAARAEQMLQAGVKKYEWLSSRDSEVRDSHMSVDGEIVAIGARFSNGLEYPLDPNGPPGETVNCRCTVIPVLD